MTRNVENPHCTGFSTEQTSKYKVINHINKNHWCKCTEPADCLPELVCEFKKSPFGSDSRFPTLTLHIAHM